jgi:hypothetical protein
MPILDDWQINLTTDDVLRMQGLDPAQVRQKRPAWVGIAEWAVQESLPLLLPQVLYQEIGIKSMTHERIYLENEHPAQRRLFVSGSLVSEHLLGAKRVIAMLCTIGPLLEEVVSGLINDDLRGPLLDGARGSETWQPTLATLEAWRSAGLHSLLR